MGSIKHPWPCLASPWHLGNSDINHSVEEQDLDSVGSDGDGWKTIPCSEELQPRDFVRC